MNLALTVLAHGGGLSWDEALLIAPVPAVVIAFFVIGAKPAQRGDDSDDEAGDDSDGDDAPADLDTRHSADLDATNRTSL